MSDAPVAQPPADQPAEHETRKGTHHPAAVLVYLTRVTDDAYGPRGNFRDLTAADAADGLKRQVLRLATPEEVERRRT